MRRDASPRRRARRPLAVPYSFCSTFYHNQPINHISIAGDNRSARSPDARTVHSSYRTSRARSCPAGNQPVSRETLTLLTHPHDAGYSVGNGWPTPADLAGRSTRRAPSREREHAIRTQMRVAWLRVPPAPQRGRSPTSMTTEERPHTAWASRSVRESPL